VRAIGATVLWLWREWLELRALFWRTARSLAARHFVGREVLHLTYDFANESLFFVFVTMGFVGMIMTFQGCFQAQRLLGDMSLIGPAFLQLTIREFGPAIGGLMVATRVGAGIAAEIGSMTVTEQIDALRMNGADPIDYLVTPRIIAGVIAMVALGTLGALCMYLVGGFTAISAFHVPAKQFFDTKLVSGLDVVAFLHKCLVFGVVIPLVAARAGFAARGGSEGVGSATTRAVIESSLWILMFDLGIGAGYFVLARLLA
jgi:phospholipid/cholesterol/gamma-HCH transport system permease protein